MSPSPFRLLTFAIVPLLLLTACDGDYERRAALVSDDAHISQTQKGSRAVIELADGHPLSALPHEVAIPITNPDITPPPPSWLKPPIIAPAVPDTSTPENANLIPADTLHLTLLAEVPIAQAEAEAQAASAAAGTAPFNPRAGYTSGRPPTFQTLLDTFSILPLAEEEIPHLNRGQRDAYLFRLGMKSTWLREDGHHVYYTAPRTTPGATQVILTADDTGLIHGSLWRRTATHEQDWYITLRASSLATVDSPHLESLVRHLATFKAWPESKSAAP